MLKKYHSYILEILDEKFETPVASYNQTARVKFLNKNQNVVFTEKYGVLRLEEIYDSLDKSGVICFDNCYIKNFSLKDYRKKSEKNSTSPIHINSFSAINTFFESESETDFSYSIFNGISLPFINSHFGSGGLNFYKSKTSDIEVDFTNVNFGNETINFQFVEFGKGNISFENTQFGESDLLFVNTQFGDGKVNFKSAQFNCENIDFHFAKFGNGDISFDKAIFGGKKIDFRRVEFGNGRLDFSRSNFQNAEVNFEESEAGNGKKLFKKSIFINCNVSFSLCNFTDELIFDNSEFITGNLSFFNANIKGLSFKTCLLNSQTDLRVEKCDYIDLSNSVIKDIVDLKPGFCKVDLKELNLAGVRNLGKIFVDWEDNNLYNLITNQTNNSNILKADQFLLLKEEFNSSGQYNDEDLAYVAYKRFEFKHRKEILLTSNSKSKIVSRISLFFQKLVFDYMGLYATSPMRVFSSMVIVYLIFSMIYFAVGLFFNTEIQTGLTNPEPLNDIAKSLYFSAITFFTIGYGDYFPHGFIRWIACIEGFSGVFMMAYFVVAFVRKMLR